MRNSLPQQIARIILADHIESGRASPGERLPTVRELEQQYVTSRSTIVHALSILEQQGWMERRQGSGCFVIERPAPEEDPSRLLAYIANFAESELMLHAYKGIEQVCCNHGFHVLVANSQNDYDLERAHLERIISAGCRAAVIVPVTRRQSQMQTDYLLTAYPQLPIVLLDIAYPEQRRTQVVFNNYQAGYDMTELLLKEGHRRIAFMDVDQPQDTYMHFSTRERYRGYRDALRTAAVPFHADDRWIVSDRLPIADVAKAILPFLLSRCKPQERPTALIAIDDVTAVHTIQLAQQVGLIIPDDLSVAGFDNTSIARSFRPPFPTTSPDFRQALLYPLLRARGA